MTRWVKRCGRRRLWLPIALAALTAAAVAIAPLQSEVASATAKPSASLRAEPGHQRAVPVVISELPVPPTVPANGVCTNPTGCVSGSWGALGSPGFYWDSHYVLLGVNYAGAPSTGPASIYSGPQVVLVKTDGATFSNGDAWKCVTCGVPAGSDVVTSDYTYPPPHALPGDKKVLVGNAILECTSPEGFLYVVSDPRCTPADTHIYPIYWGDTPLGGSSPASRSATDGSGDSAPTAYTWPGTPFSSAELPWPRKSSKAPYRSTDQPALQPDRRVLPAPTGAVGGRAGQPTEVPAICHDRRAARLDQRRSSRILGIQSYESDSIEPLGHLTSPPAGPRH